MVDTGPPQGAISNNAFRLVLYDALRSHGYAHPAFFLLVLRWNSAPAMSRLESPRFHLPSNSSSCRRWLWWSDCDLRNVDLLARRQKDDVSSCVAQVDVGQRAGCEVIGGLSYRSCQTLDTHTLGPHDDHRRAAGRQSHRMYDQPNLASIQDQWIAEARLRLNSVSPSTIGSSAGC
jgi:hypothetical protein